MMTQTVNGRSAARINAADLRWIQDEDLVKFREFVPQHLLLLCGVCGSPNVNRFDKRSGARWV